MARLRSKGVWVSHQPRSNMNNAVGVAAVPTMLRGGVKLALGNDGFSNDMFEEMRVAYLLHKAAGRDPRLLPADQLLQVAVGNNAAAGRALLRPISGPVAGGRSRGSHPAGL